LEIIISNTLFTGKVLTHLPKVDSTNNYAKEMLAKSSPIDGTVILADEQFAGRGQTGNIWQSEAHKNLTFSIIYQTSFLKATEQFWLNMAISLGMQSFLKQLQPTASIKWPNDIYINSKKIAGILIENTIIGMHLKYSVIGIGLNVNQENFAKDINATSLSVVLEKEMNKNEILNQLLASIEKYFLLLKERKLERLKSEYLENLFRYTILSTFKKNDIEFEGKIIDVDEYGNLIVETKNGSKISEEKFGFKEIAFVI
jgi:BirA family biotin operon repressor/biotin-[acetyl-CoA-carboxylase] ligase